MREMTFKMERPGMLEEGQRVTVTEGELPGSYYYTIDPSLAMSPNIELRDRLTVNEGTVVAIEENHRGYYVTVSFLE